MLFESRFDAFVCAVWVFRRHGRVQVGDFRLGGDGIAGKVVFARATGAEITEPTTIKAKHSHDNDV